MMVLMVLMVPMEKNAPEIFISKFSPDIIYGDEGDLWIRH